jgi:hypothetical protein
MENMHSMKLAHLKESTSCGALLLAVGFLLSIAGCSGSSSDSSTPSTNSAKPNILFIVMDDVGIDQMKFAGYGGLNPANTPVIDAILANGVTFTNTWAAPECSPSRAMYFNGRYPIRTAINSAIIPLDLANSSMNPDEVTTPRVLRNAGYVSALIGKSHIAGYSAPGVISNDPYGETAMSQLGWDYFKGWVDAAPYPIDTTAGGIGAKDPKTNLGPYACGYIPTVAQDSVNGANAGACYTANGNCTQMNLASSGVKGPGRACLESGGILAPNAICQTTTPAPITAGFATQNAYYAGNLVENLINQKNAIVTAPNNPSGASRGYRSVIESNATIQWINGQPGGTPWMATMAFAAAHAPFQPPPPGLISGIDTVNGQDCASEVGIKTIMRQMIESMDSEIGRVLVETGIATRNSNGSIHYDPAKSNTVIVITGDNGSYFSTVNEPFSPLRSKGYVNQTGVWVPLVVAGPMVVSPGRQVNAMIHVADLYEFWGEVAGLKVRDYVPVNRAVDAKPMMAYLKNPNQSPIRDFNFTYGAENLRSTEVKEKVQGACVIGGVNVCTTIVPNANSCGMEGGVWYGPGNILGVGPFNNCCDAAKYIANDGGSTPSMLPLEQYSVRNATYKLNQITTNIFTGISDVQMAACKNPEPVLQLFKVSEASPRPLIDRPPGTLGSNNLDVSTLSGADLVAFNSLLNELDRIKSSVKDCQGDGNLDGLVDQKDISGYTTWAATTAGGSSWYDFNLDGLTDQKDLTVIQQNLGTICQKPR